MCERCKDFYERHPLGEEGHEGTYLGGAVTCAFDENGDFKIENWNCRTMTFLRDYCLEQYTNRDDADGGSIGVFTIPENDLVSGYLVLTYYKNRGRTEGAYVMYSDDSPEPLTLEIADEIIEGVEGGL